MRDKNYLFIYLLNKIKTLVLAGEVQSKYFHRCVDRNSSHSELEPKVGFNISAD